MLILSDRVASIISVFYVNKVPKEIRLLIRVLLLTQRPTMAQCTGDNQRAFGGGPLPHVSVDWPSTQAWCVISGVANHTGGGRSFHGFIALSTSLGHWRGKGSELLLLESIPICYPTRSPFLGYAYYQLLLLPSSIRRSVDGSIPHCKTGLAAYLRILRRYSQS